MMASLNTGTSSGLREVMRFPSSTTGLSTYSPPAFLTSIAIDGQQVSVRLRSVSAEMRSWGPWQIAATGLPASIASRARSTIAWRMRILSGAWPPGMTSASKSFMRAAPAATSEVTIATPRFPLNATPAVGPTSTTVAPASRSASSGPLSSRSSNSSSTSIATRLPYSDGTSAIGASGGRLYIRCSRGNFGRQTSVVRRNVDQLRANTRADRRFRVAQKILKRSDAAKLVLIDKFGVEHVSDDRFMELVRDVLAGTRARVADRRRCPRTPLYPPRRVVSRDEKLVWCAHAKRLPAGHRLAPACRSLSLHDRDVELHGMGRARRRAGSFARLSLALARRPQRQHPPRAHHGARHESVGLPIRSFLCAPESPQARSSSPPLSPADALKTFYLPPGYSIELVASEPLVQDPVAVDWDLDGRLWVVEMSGYMRNMAGANEHDPVGRVIVLQDENGDGRMDKRTVFADGLVLARAVKVLDRGVLVGEPPNVWLMHDTNGDLRMDTKELVTNQYGRLEGDPQNNANVFDWSLDNWMQGAAQDIALRLKNDAFEVRRTLRRGQWGVTGDDAGRIYRNTNESALHVDLVPTMYFARNPNLLRTRGSYERLSDDNPELNVVWPVRPTPATNRAYQFGILRADRSLARFTAVCAPVVYRGDRLPADLYGNVFVAEPAANLVSRIVLSDDGTTLRARKAYDRGEFLASTDERFRPVYLSNAPDGTLYIVDMYRGIIEDRLSMTEYLRDQIVARKLEQPIGLGRIYRVVHETTRRDTSRALATASAAQ